MVEVNTTELLDQMVHPADLIHFSDLIDLVDDGGESVLALLGREVVELLGLVPQEGLVVVVVIVLAHVVLVFVMTAEILEPIVMSESRNTFPCIANNC